MRDGQLLTGWGAETRVAAMIGFSAIGLTLTAWGQEPGSTKSTAPAKPGTAGVVVPTDPDRQGPRTDLPPGDDEQKLPGLAKPAPRKPARPAIVDPGLPGTPTATGMAPSDAVVLFDGTSFDGWVGSKKDQSVSWALVNGAMEVTPRSGEIRTKNAFGFGQYHIEFRTPSVVKGNGQGRGNSGVYPLGGPEIQVLDSFNNDTYPDGQCGAIYNQHIPLVNASRQPGVWQSYDIIVHAPRLDKDGKLLMPAAYTVLHNGVLIHDHIEMPSHKDPTKTGNFRLQDHGNPVQYRNIWYRPSRTALTKAETK